MNPSIRGQNQGPNIQVDQSRERLQQQRQQQHAQNPQHSQQPGPIPQHHEPRATSLQSWQYPLNMAQYSPAAAAAFGAAFPGLRLSSPAPASVVPVPMVYSPNNRASKGRQPGVQEDSSDPASQPAGGQTESLGSAAGAGHQQDDTTIVEVPPDQMKELLEIREIKQRRLARKAELARISRRRTRDMLQSVEEEITKLEAELRAVRAQSVRPCVRCDKRLTLPEMIGEGDVEGPESEAKSSFEMAKLKLPKFEDSLKTKAILDEGLEKARVFIHKSMVSSLDTFAKERKKRQALSNRPKVPPITPELRPLATPPGISSAGLPPTRKHPPPPPPPQQQQQQQQQHRQQSGFHGFQHPTPSPAQVHGYPPPQHPSSRQGLQYQAYTMAPLPTQALHLQQLQHPHPPPHPRTPHHHPQSILHGEARQSVSSAGMGVKVKVESAAAGTGRREAKDRTRDPMESSVELEKFLVENLVTQYKRQHLVARFHLAAFEQFMRASLPINTLFCFLLERDASKFVERAKSAPNPDSATTLIAELKLSGEQIKRTDTIRGKLQQLLARQYQLEEMYATLHRELFISSPPPTTHPLLLSSFQQSLHPGSRGETSIGAQPVATIREKEPPYHRSSVEVKRRPLRAEPLGGMLQIKREHDRIWHQCAQEVRSVLTPGQTAALFRWGLQNPASAQAVIRSTLQSLKDEIKPRDTRTEQQQMQMQPGSHGGDGMEIVRYQCNTNRAMQ